MLMLDRISGFNVDPSGQYATFNVRSTDMEKNKGVSTLWLKDLTKPAVPEVKLAVSEGGAYRCAVGSRRKAVVLLVRSRRRMVSRKCGAPISMERRRSRSLASALDVNAYRITPDGKGVVVSLAVFPDCDGDAIACTVQAECSTRCGQVHRHGVHQALRAPLGYLGRWNAQPLVSRGHRCRTNRPCPDAGFRWRCALPSLSVAQRTSPFRRTHGPCTIAARVAGTTEPWSTNFDIFSVPITGGAQTNLTAANKAWDATPRMSPDGRTLAYKAMKRPGFEADRFEIQLRDEAGNGANARSRLGTAAWMTCSGAVMARACW